MINIIVLSGAPLFVNVSNLTLDTEIYEKNFVQLNVFYHHIQGYSEQKQGIYFFEKRSRKF